MSSSRFAHGSLVVAGLLLALVAGSVRAAPEESADRVIAKATEGDPPVASIQVIRFAPGGVLLIGDGKASQVVAVRTSAKKEAASFSDGGGIDAINRKVASRLGTEPDGVDLLDLAVHPISGRAYLAVRKHNEKRELIVRVDGKGRIDAFPLKDLEYARVPLPEEDTKISKITDVAWAGKRLLAAGRANEKFASKIFATPGRIKHDQAGYLYSAKTYHVSHGRWETKAPMHVLMPYEEQGQQYVVGAYTCTPVVKYPIGSIQPGAKVEGRTKIELGSGNRPQDLIRYEKDGTHYILTNTYRFHHDRRPFGPSPYWACCLERSLLGGNKKVNKDAVRRLNSDHEPQTDRIQLIEAYHGVMQMARLDSDHALILRERPKAPVGGEDADAVDLEVLPLP